MLLKNEKSIVKLFFGGAVIGAFVEYAMSFTDSEMPYVTFLENVKNYLSDTGKILLSIENRLGIKYFSGALEDHTNEYYIGLRQYIGNKTVRTFSKAELEDIFRKCNISTWKFYYPYPDYKFPTEIYTDENVNSNEYGKWYRNYQMEKVELFSEFEMIQTLKKEGVMGNFSNSFLVELSISHQNGASEIVYAKMNNGRKRKFCISTIIMGEGKSRIVRKIALNEDAVGHIRCINENQKAVLSSKLVCLHGKMRDDFLEYPYLQSPNLDAHISNLVEENNIREIRNIIDDMYNIINDAAVLQQDIYTEDFRQYFGSEVLDKSIPCVKNWNIDLIFDNLYLSENGYMVIDPEWLCDFWVPAGFIFWRMLNEWYAKHAYAEKVMPSQQLYQEYGITEKTEKVFRSWAIHFATRYVAANNLDLCAIPVKKVDINRILKEAGLDSILMSSLYIDYGEGFSETNKMDVKVRLDGKNYQFRTKLDTSREVRAIRFDPTEFKFCKCIVNSCILDDEEIEVVPNNSDKHATDVFLNLDPQFALCVKPGKYALLEMKGTFELLDDVYVNNVLENMKSEINELDSSVKSLKLDRDRTCMEKEKVQQYNTILLAAHDVLQVDNEKKYKELQSMSADISKANKHIQDLKEENNVVRNNLLQMSERCAEVENKLNAIENSKSWKLISVFRKLRKADHE